MVGGEGGEQQIWGLRKRSGRPRFVGEGVRGGRAKVASCLFGVPVTCGVWQHRLLRAKAREGSPARRSVRESESRGAVEPSSAWPPEVPPTRPEPCRPPPPSPRPPRGPVSAPPSTPQSQQRPTPDTSPSPGNRARDPLSLLLPVIYLYTDVCMYIFTYIYVYLCMYK